MELARCGSFHLWLSHAIGGWSWFWVAPPKPGLQHTPKKQCQGHVWGTGIWCGWVCDAIIRGIDVPTSDGCSTCGVAWYDPYDPFTDWCLVVGFYTPCWLAKDIPAIKSSSTSQTPSTALCPICGTCGTQQLRTVDQGGIRSRHLICSRWVHQRFAVTCFFVFSGHSSEGQKKTTKIYIIRLIHDGKICIHSLYYVFTHP